MSHSLPLGMALGMAPALTLLACSEVAPPGPEPVATAVASASAAPASSVVVPPPAPPTLGLVPMFSSELGDRAALYQIQGALVVAAGTRVGRVTKEGVAWVEATVPAGSPALGPNQIVQVAGVYPDAIDVVFRSTNGRAPTPTYFPLTGKGHASVFASGGGAGWISGLARVGETTLLAGSEWTGSRIVAVRGPNLKTTSISAAKAGCTEAEVPPNPIKPRGPAVDPYVFGASASGRAVALGMFCRERGPAAEVWDAKGETSALVPLKPHLKDLGGSTQLLAGAGDRVFVVDPGEKVALQLEGEKVTALPRLPGPRLQGFVSADHVLHVSDGLAIHRLEEGAWRLLAHLQWPTEFGQLGLLDGETWGTVLGGLVRLAPAPSLEAKGECATPFVHLYDVSALSEPTFTFPTTRKALTSFAKADRIGMVEFREGVRRLGLTVPSKEIGEEVIAHVKATMKDESPRLICYAPPSSARTIPLGKVAGK